MVLSLAHPSSSRTSRSRVARCTHLCDVFYTFKPVIALLTEIFKWHYNDYDNYCQATLNSHAQLDLFSLQAVGRTLAGQSRSSSKPWNSGCIACVYFKEKSKHHMQRAKLKKFGVKDLPTFDVPAVRANPSCEDCQQRCAYNRRKVARCMGKKKGQSLSNS